MKNAQTGQDRTGGLITITSIVFIYVSFKVFNTKSAFIPIKKYIASFRDLNRQMDTERMLVQSLKKSTRPHPAELESELQVSEKTAGARHTI